MIDQAADLTRLLPSHTNLIMDHLYFPGSEAINKARSLKSRNFTLSVF